MQRRDRHQRDEPSGVLVLPYGTGLGDLTLQYGLLQAISRRWPRAEVSVFAPPAAAPLLPPGIRLRTSILGIPAWRRIQGAGGMFRLLGPLEWRTIDALVRAMPPSRLARLSARALAEAFDVVIDLLGAFTNGVDFERDWTAPAQRRPVHHIVNVLADYLSMFDVEVTAADRAAMPPLPDVAISQAAELVANLPAGVPRVLIHPHAGSPLKLPDPPFWQVFAYELHRAGLQTLVSAGGTGAERRAARTIAGNTALALPPLPLQTLVALGRYCALTIAPDTGLLHLIERDGQRWVGLFGSTNPYLAGPYPRSNGTLILSPPPGGRPCATCWQRFAVGSTCCPPFPGNSCLSRLDPRQVARQVVDAIEREGANRAATGAG